MKRELLGGVLLIGLLSGSWYLATQSVVSAEEEGEENEENYESDSEKNEVGEREEGASSAQRVSLPLYQMECGSCHVAYSPGHLPETSWRTIMNNLDRHYGEDASIDATTAKTITDSLITHSGAQ